MCPVLLIHARGDRDLESSNSARLFEAMLVLATIPDDLKKDFRLEEIGVKNL